MANSYFEVLCGSGKYSYVCIMGRQSKKPASDAFYNMSRMMVPRDLLEFFEVSDIKEQASEWDVILEEKVSVVPVALAGVEDAVLDGFCNPIRLMSHCFSINTN